MEKEKNTFIKSLRTDRGGEFLSSEFNSFCDEHGIFKELTARYTLQQNGVAEMASSLLKANGLLNQFWAKAVSTSVYLLNISPTRAVLNQTPYEAWRGRRPTVSHLRIFGCIAYAFVSSQFRHKLDNKSEKCIFFLVIAINPKHISYIIILVAKFL